MSDVITRLIKVKVKVNTMTSISQRIAMQCHYSANVENKVKLNTPIYRTYIYIHYTPCMLIREKTQNNIDVDGNRLPIRKRVLR